MDEQLAEQSLSPTEPLPSVDNGQASDVNELQEQVAQLQQDNNILAHNYAQALEKLGFFEEQLRLLKHQHFGRSSEKTSPEQALLFNADAEEESVQSLSDGTTTISYERKKKNPPKRNQFPTHWPRREIIHDIDPAHKLDAHGEPLTVIGYDEFEQVRVCPARHEVIVHKRPKYAHEAEDGSTEMLQAPPARVPLPKSMATPSLLADIFTSKFVEHLPLHRYEQRCARVDFALPRSTQARWLMLRTLGTGQGHRTSKGFQGPDRTTFRHHPRGTLDIFHHLAR